MSLFSYCRRCDELNETCPLLFQVEDGGPWLHDCNPAIPHEPVPGPWPEASRWRLLGWLRWGTRCAVCHVHRDLNPPDDHENWLGHKWRRWPLSAGERG